jgi:hypothetical protein
MAAGKLKKPKTVVIFHGAGPERNSRRISPRWIGYWGITLSTDPLARPHLAPSPL